MKISNEDIIKLQLVHGLGRKTINKILNYIEFKNITINNFTEAIKIIKDLGIKRLKIDEDKIEEESEKILESCKKNKIKIISLYDRDYPNKLNNVEDKPLILYVDGNEELLTKNNNIAIVGTRHPSQQGYEVSSIIAEKLTENNICIVSGFASGCDEAAHIGCITAKGKTIAVVPFGLQALPKGSKALYNRIIYSGGTIISEVPPFSKAEKYNFIDRNRLIAALSEGVIVIEGGYKGGTSHTVNFAKEYSKPVAYTTAIINQQISIASDYEDDITIINDFEELVNFKNKICKKSC